MCNKNLFNSYDKFPYIVVKNEVIAEVNQQFIHITGFNYEEIIKCNVEDIFRTLRVGSLVNIDKIDERIDYFLFNKSLEVKFVNIRVIHRKEEKVYIFLEKLNSNLDVKLPLASMLCLDNYYGTGIYSMPDMTLLKANDKYISFFDEPFDKKENCLGKHISEFTTGFTGSSYEDIWNIVLKTGKPYNIEEYKYEGLDRGITYWKLYLVPIYEGSKIKYCVEMVAEVTEQVLHRKKVEEQENIIKQQNKFLKWQTGLLERSREAILAWDLEEGIVYWNKGAEQMYGYSSEEALGCMSHKLLKTVYPEDFENIKLTMLSKGLWNGELEHTRKDGTKLIVETYHQIFTDEDGHKVILETNRDITEQIMQDKAIEYHQKALLQAEREKSEALEKAIEMKDEFLSLISHEFRTPLNVIHTAVQALNHLCGNELSDRSQKYINTIRQNAFRQLRLVNNLLDITRADAGRIKIYKRNIDVVFLTNSIVESVYTYASQKGVELKFISSIEKKIIGIDEEKYERILLNLLSNAIKFTPAGKLITVKLRIVKRNVYIEVKDNGIGIPEDKVDVIFERFGQVDSSLSRQAEGAGIGLSLVKRLVIALGGSISVKSKEGKGSTFTILFPDEKVLEEADINPMVDLIDNRLVQVAKVEFSDIYL